MSSRSCIFIVTEEHKVTINKVFEAMNLGPDNIAMPASVDGQEPATHRYGHAWADEATSVAWLALGEGVLPTIVLVDGVWGRDGLPTEQEAITATTGFTISVATGGVIPTEHLVGILSGMGLQQVEIV